MTNKNNITALLYVRNDEVNIARAITSAQLLTLQIMVIDIASDDNTAKVSRELGAEVHSVENASHVELVRMKGIKHVKTDWVFILDSDEVITPQLAQEIKLISTSLTNSTHYRVSRKNIFNKTKWLKHGGWWPDYQTRLIKCGAISSWPTAIHSTPQIEGVQGFLKEPLLHYSHGDFQGMVNKTIKFEGIESDLLHKAGKKASTATFFRKYFGELYRRLIKQKGFLDGREGFAESIYQAYSKTITYLMLYEKNRIV